MKLQLHIKQIDDIIYFDKPSGWNTHSPDTGLLGTQEVLQQCLNFPIYPVHRLDKTTSGTLIFAKTQKMAQELFLAFKDHKVEKTYWFITPARNTDNKSILSNSKRTDNNFTSISKIKSPNIESKNSNYANNTANPFNTNSSTAGDFIGGDSFGDFVSNSDNIPDDISDNYELDKSKPANFEPDDSEFEIQSCIEKLKSGVFQNLVNQPANSWTRFRRIKRSPFFELWQAQPKSGKPHQIRLHAALAGIPILGDSLYGGAPFPYLCLHSKSLKYENYFFDSPAPRFFERLGLLKDPELVSILASIDFRQRVYNFLQHPNECLRLIHHEIPEIRLDKYGPQMWLYWYKDSAPTKQDILRWEFVSSILKSPIFLKQMVNRGDHQDHLKVTENKLWDTVINASNLDNKTQWTAHENGIQYSLKQNQGQSPGLFLDQRENRAFLAELCQKKLSVLNLFSYTCGFSVVAAQNGASEVTSVDVSDNFLQWGLENHKLNKSSTQDTDSFSKAVDSKFQNQNCQFEVFKSDSRFFLDRCQKKSRKFDIIILDPPSFSRKTSKQQGFQIQKDLPHLIKQCLSVLNKNGYILVSCNYEKWNHKDFQMMITKTVKSFSNLNFKLISTPHTWDFEKDFNMKTEDSKLMKSVWIHVLNK